MSLSRKVTATETHITRACVKDLQEGFVFRVKGKRKWFELSKKTLLTGSMFSDIPEQHKGCYLLLSGCKQFILPPDLEVEIDGTGRAL